MSFYWSSYKFCIVFMQLWYGIYITYGAMSVLRLIKTLIVDYSRAKN